MPGRLDESAVRAAFSGCAFEGKEGEEELATENGITDDAIMMI